MYMFSLLTEAVVREDPPVHVPGHPGHLDEEAEDAEDGPEHPGVHARGGIPASISWYVTYSTL